MNSWHEVKTFEKCIIKWYDQIKVRILPRYLMLVCYGMRATHFDLICCNANWQLTDGSVNWWCWSFKSSAVLYWTRSNICSSDVFFSPCVLLKNDFLAFLIKLLYKIGEWNSRLFVCLFLGGTNPKIDQTKQLLLIHSDLNPSVFGLYHFRMKNKKNEKRKKTSNRLETLIMLFGSHW